MSRLLYCAASNATGTVLFEVTTFSVNTRFQYISYHALLALSPCLNKPASAGLVFWYTPAWEIYSKPKTYSTVGGRSKETDIAGFLLGQTHHVEKIR